MNHGCSRFDHIEDSDEDQAPKDEPEEVEPEEPNNPSEEQRRELKLKFFGHTAFGQMAVAVGTV